MRTAIERFYSKVKINHKTDCHEWNGILDKDGYGKFYALKDKKVSAHRWICEPIPDGMYVLHKCDNRKCVNRAHLYFGTQKDNMKDMVNRGRHKNPKIKLTEFQVRKIRADNRGATVIAKDYGLNPWSVWAIKTKRVWAHID